MNPSTNDMRCLQYVEELNLHVQIISRAKLVFDDDVFKETLKKLIKQLPIIHRYRNAYSSDDDSDDDSDDGSDVEIDDNNDDKKRKIPCLPFMRYGYKFKSSGEFDEWMENPIWKQEGHESRILLLKEMERSLQVIQLVPDILTDRELFRAIKQVMDNLTVLPPNLLRCDEHVNRMCKWDEQVDPLKQYETLDDEDFELRKTIAIQQRIHERRLRLQGRWE